MIERKEDETFSKTYAAVLRAGRIPGSRRV
jgi:hypothetical protein